MEETGKLTDEQLTKFSALFQGLGRAYGIWYPSSGSVETVRKEITPNIYADHLNGKVGLGIPMVMDNSKCHFGVIDIDYHGEDTEADFSAIEYKIDTLELPLVMCRSKRGGAHLYLFCNPPASAAKVNKVLKGWAGQLGFGKSEVFPKQTKIGPKDVGNWINLPYFDYADTVRPCIKAGQKIGLNNFLSLAEGNVQKSLSEAKAADEKVEVKSAPPCLLHLMNLGIDEGYRNEALFNFGVYYRKAHPADWQDKLLALNYTKFSPPLAKQEVDIIVKQVSGAKEYNYKCNVEPLVSYCDRDTCLNSRYGVKANAGIGIELTIGELKKVLSMPPRWILVVNGQEVEVSTKELMKWELLREAILERVDMVAPPMNKEDWLTMLRDRIESKIDIDAPEDASIGGVIASRLSEFTMRAINTNGDGFMEAGDREVLLRGMPVLLYGTMEKVEKGGRSVGAMTGINSDGKGSPFVFFRGGDFVDFLKKRRSEEVKGDRLWSMMRFVGCGHVKMRIGRGVHQLWYKAAEPFSLDEFSNPVDKQKEEF